MNDNNKRPHSDIDESPHPTDIPDNEIPTSERPHSRPRFDSPHTQHTNNTSLIDPSSFRFAQEQPEQEEEMTLEDAAKAFEDAYREAHGHGVGEGPGDIQGGGIQQREVKSGVEEGRNVEVLDGGQVEEQHVQHGIDDHDVSGEPINQTSLGSDQNQSIIEESNHQEEHITTPVKDDINQPDADNQQVETNGDIVMQDQSEMEGQLEVEVEVEGEGQGERRDERRKVNRMADRMADKKASKKVKRR